MSGAMYFFLIVLVIAGSIYLYKYLNQFYEVQDFRYNHYVEIFDGSNISKYQYLRHKIIIQFKDIKLFNIDKLTELGGEDYIIENNTLSFRFKGSNDNNYILYLKIKEKIEG